MPPTLFSPLRKNCAPYTIFLIIREIRGKNCVPLHYFDNQCQQLVFYCEIRGKITKTCIHQSVVFLYSPQKLVTVSAIDWLSEIFPQENMTFHLFSDGLADVHGAPPPPEGGGILWEGLYLLRSPIG